MQRRALIVDDEPAMCELMQEVLNSTGMASLALTLSADAPEHLQREKFDVVLLDFRMPSPDGVELTRQIRRSGFNRMTPIILVSEDQQPAAVSLGFEAGASFFLYKPIDKGRLLKLIRATQGSIEHERRRFRRVPHQSKVQLKSDATHLEGETIDLSLNGMLVKAQPTVSAGSSVHFSLFLTPGIEPVVGMGSIMRVIGADQMGIQIDRLTANESGRLQEFLLPLIVPETASAVSGKIR
jgi:DNA-binding response OmpR family regulator